MKIKEYYALHHKMEEDIIFECPTITVRCEKPIISIIKRYSRIIACFPEPTK